MSILSPVGKINRLFGLDGGVLVNLYDTFPGDMNNEGPLFVRIDGLAVPLFIEHFERRGQRGALVRFADIDNPVRAGEMIGHEIFVQGGDGPGKGWRGDAEGAAEATAGDMTAAGDAEGEDDGELFLDELVGYRATAREDSEGGRCIEGTITAFIDSDMNPLFELEADGRELFIPAADDFIECIDTQTREIGLLIPEGLLDLYL